MLENINIKDEKNNIEYGLNTVGNFKIGGFATGNYECICHECGITFIDDKYSTICLQCVINNYDKIFEEYLKSHSKEVAELSEIVSQNLKESKKETS